MKKIILLLGVLVLGSAVFAADCTYSCVEPYDKSGKISSFFSKITGMNYTRTKVTEGILKKLISKTVQGDKNLKVDLNSYSAKDLSNGIFKSLKISGKDVNIGGVYLSEFELKSLCDFNYIQYDKKGNLTFKEDFPAYYALRMNADDINKTMQSSRYQKIINDVNRLGFAGVKVSSAQVDIRGNKFYYIINISIPFIKAEKKIELTADLNVENGKIDFENTRLASNSFNFDLKKAKYLMNYLNPLDFSVNIFDNKNAKITIKNISVKNNEIHADGLAIVPKD